MEPKKDGKTPFLGCIITRLGSTLQTNVYRKPFSASRLLDNSSYHPISHKLATVLTLNKRAHVICSSNEDLQADSQHLNKVFTINAHPQSLVQNVLTFQYVNYRTRKPDEREEKTIVTNDTVHQRYFRTNSNSP